jgi:hypothetical protein
VAADGVIEEMVGTELAPEDPVEEYADEHEGEVDEAFDFDLDSIDFGDGDLAGEGE